MEDSAYRRYRRRSGEEAVLERRQKQRQIAASIEFFSRKDLRNSSRTHHQHLLRLQGQYRPSPHPTCSNVNCNNKCLPFSTKCQRRIPHIHAHTHTRSYTHTHTHTLTHSLTHSTDICGDPKQLLYATCSYIYPSGTQCSSPVPIYLNPPLCGGHCDTAVTSQNSDHSQRPGTSGEGASQTCSEAREKDSAAEVGGSGESAAEVGGSGERVSVVSDREMNQESFDDSLSQSVTEQEREERE